MSIEKFRLTETDVLCSQSKPAWLRTVDWSIGEVFDFGEKMMRRLSTLNWRPASSHDIEDDFSSTSTSSSRANTYQLSAVLRAASRSAVLAFLIMIILAVSLEVAFESSVCLTEGESSGARPLWVHIPVDRPGEGYVSIPLELFKTTYMDRIIMPLLFAVIVILASAFLVQNMELESFPSWFSALPSAGLLEISCIIRHLLGFVEARYRNLYWVSSFTMYSVGFRFLGNLGCSCIVTVQFCN